VMLEARLSHRFAGFTLDVAFQAPAGVTALFGRSGAGKSSVVRAIAGLLRCDSAELRLDGTVLEGPGLRLPPHRRQIGCVFQEPRLFPHLNVRQNLTYSRLFRHPRGGLGLDDVVSLLGLGALLARSPRHLSGGEKARVGIGRALLSAPRLLLLDEPLAALDEGHKAEILPYLEGLRDQAGLPMVLVSHALPEVARLATSIVVLAQGRVAAAGPVEAVLSDPALVAVMGLREAGAVITARHLGREGDGVSALETGAGRIYLPGVNAAPGAPLRLRVPAQHVILALSRPEGLSALNILAVEVLSLTPAEGGGVLVALRLGEQRLLARVTERSATALGLRPGLECHAILKSVALAGAM
jgi:molybdate transport system ATP-binding protein